MEKLFRMEASGRADLSSGWMEWVAGKLLIGMKYPVTGGIWFLIGCSAGEIIQWMDELGRWEAL